MILQVLQWLFVRSDRISEMFRGKKKGKRRGKREEGGREEGRGRERGRGRGKEDEAYQRTCFFSGSSTVHSTALQWQAPLTVELMVYGGMGVVTRMN